MEYHIKKIKNKDGKVTSVNIPIDEWEEIIEKLDLSNSDENESFGDVYPIPAAIQENVEKSYQYIRDHFKISPEELIRMGKIGIDPHKMSGTACFYNSRLPVESLFNYVKNGYSLEKFEDDFEIVTKEEAEYFLSIAK